MNDATHSTESSPFSQQFSQFSILLKKNLWLFIKDWKTTCICIFSPVVFIILLWLLQNIYVYEMNQIGSFNDPEPIERIPQCQEWGGKHCWTLLYTVEEINNTLLGDVSSVLESFNTEINHLNEMQCNSNYESITACRNISHEFYPSNSNISLNFNQADDIMRYIGIHNDPPLIKGSNFEANDGDYVSIPQKSILYDYIADNINQTQNAILFQTYNGTIFGYTVLYNSSLNIVSESTLPSIIRSVDEALHSLNPNTNTKLEITLGSMGFPKSKPRFLTSSIIQMAGPVFFFCPPMLIFIILLNKIVFEKEKKLRQGMNIMGLSDSMFWLSWFITSEILFSIITIIIILSGMIAQFEFFLNVRFGINFLAFFLFSSAMTPVIFICSTIVSTSKQANLLGFFIFLTGLFLQMIFTNVAIYYWYSPDSSPYWLLLFNLYPPFNFAKCCADFIIKAYPSYSASSHSYSTSLGYSWYDLTQVVYVPLISIDAPPTIFSFVYLAMDMCIFLILTWYLDNVIPSVNGTSKPFYFLFLPSYWEIHIQKKDNNNSHSNMDIEMTELSSPLLAEFEDEFENNDTESNKSAVEIKNLTKIYSRSCIWPGNKNNYHAVSDLSLTINKGTIFCMLGHNGAGKTTLFNILTGVSEPSSGSANIFGYDIISQKGEVNKIMGVCPQHDLLWEELTAWQHLEIFSQLKGIPSSERKKVIVSKLEQVGLLQVSKNQVKTYSGGMKRRLSVAISSVCDPKIMFFDEPTTGLDPVSKRNVWKLIKQLKEDRVIIFTTHSMEEADYLSDEIGIMNLGKLITSGTSVELRNEYGNGYKLSFVCIPEYAEKLQNTITTLLPEAHFITSNAGSISYTIPTSVLSELSLFFKEIESIDGLSSSIIDWGVAHTSLEEVFHNVTTFHND